MCLRKVCFNLIRRQNNWWCQIHGLVDRPGQISRLAEALLVLPSSGTSSLEPESLVALVALLNPTTDSCSAHPLSNISLASLLPVLSTSLPHLALSHNPCAKYPTVTIPIHYHQSPSPPTRTYQTYSLTQPHLPPTDLHRNTRKPYISTLSPTFVADSRHVSRLS